MAVYRVNKNRGYTVMANFHLRDKSLSLKAVGLLSKMLSFNDGWKFSTKGLSAICKEGPDAILSALRELEKHGYLVRHRQRDGKGRMSNTIFEIYPCQGGTNAPAALRLSDHIVILQQFFNDRTMNFLKHQILDRAQSGRQDIQRGLAVHQLDGAV